MPRLEEKVCLVTGAARGIGAAVAEAFVREGAASVLATDIRDEEGRALAERLGPRAAYRRLDVRREADWEDAVGALLAEHGRLDVLVNNAGITGFEEAPGPHDPEHLSLEGWRAVHATNLDGVFLGCRHGLRAMREGGGAGSIVNVASRQGVAGVARAAAYASSKAAVINHTRSVALYCAEEKLPVRCNAVLPGAIMTPMWELLLEGAPDRDAAVRELVHDVPAGRMGTPEEVASLVVHLASDESAYTTGAPFLVDGGLTAGTAARPPSTEG